MKTDITVSQLHTHSHATNRMDVSYQLCGFRQVMDLTADEALFVVEKLQGFLEKEKGGE